MISFIRGKVVSFTSESVIIDNNGIGFYIYYMHPESLTLGEERTIVTYMHFREDATVLYGFVDQEERELFTNLISVKGLGPKTAITMLGAASYHKIIEAIEQGDVAFLKKMPSIGAKTASQIVLDLKGKLIETDNNDSAKDNPLILEAVDGLKALGYKAGEINPILPELRKMDKKTSNDYIKEGLRLILKRKGG